MHNVYITIDVDWAPDWAMRKLLDALVRAQVRSTWFVTHESPMLGELRALPDLVELGIHPNFQAGSSHGDPPSDVLTECMRMVPEARVMRTHCLVQSTPILQIVADETPIVVDTSLYLRDAMNVRASELPLDRGRTLTRVPYVWEDDLEFFAKSPRWDGISFLRERDSPTEVTVIDVHPIHFALNSADIGPYQALKSAVGDTRRVSQAEAEPFVHTGSGTATFIDSLLRAREVLDISFAGQIARLAPR